MVLGFSGPERRLLGASMGRPLNAFEQTQKKKGLFENGPFSTVRDGRQLRGSARLQSQHRQR